MRIAIVGSGLAGSVMAYYFLKSGVDSITIFDEFPEFSSTKVAAGLYNPITGKQRKFTWKVEEIFSMIEPFYHEIEKETQSSFLKPMPILMPFVSDAEKISWEEHDSISSVVKIDVLDEVNYQIHAPFGAMLVRPAGYLDTRQFLNSLQKWFRLKGVAIIKQRVYHSDWRQTENGTWKHMADEFDKVVFCEGHKAQNNPFFNFLKFAPVKGEILDLRIIGLCNEQIINKAMFLLPSETEETFRCGSTYRHEWQHETEPETEGLDDIRKRLEKVFLGNYEVIGAKAGIRPATRDRKPILGQHPEKKNLYVFNGLGTKGVSLAPYFGKMMLDLVLNNIQPDFEVSSDRFLTT